MKSSVIHFFWALFILTGCTQGYDEIFVSSEKKQTLSDYYDKADKLLDSDPAQAEKQAMAALRIAESGSYTQGMGNAHFMLGLAYDYQGNYGPAVSHHLQGLQYRESVHDQQGMIRSYNSLAILYQTLELYEEAQQHFEKGLALAIEVKNQEEQAKIYYNLGRLYRATKAYAQAESYYTQSLDLYEWLGSKKYVGYVYNELAMLSELKPNPDYQQVLAYYQKALQINQQNPSLEGIGWVLGNIGRTYVQLGQPQEALSYLAQAETHLTNDYVNLASTLTAKAEAYIALKNRSEAQKALTQAEALEPHLKGANKESLQQVYKLAQQFYGPTSPAQREAYGDKEKNLEAQLAAFRETGQKEQFKSQASVRKAESDYLGMLISKVNRQSKIQQIFIAVILICLGVIIYLYCRLRRLAREYYTFIKVYTKGTLISHLK